MIQFYNPHAVRYFIDTEFYEDGSTIDLISIGVKCSDGNSFYAANKDARLDRVEGWHRSNVLPHLPPYSSKDWKSRKEIAEALKTFTHLESLIEFWGFYSAYDWVAVCQLYKTMMDIPHWWPKRCNDLKQVADMLGCETRPPKGGNVHHALADAEWNEALFEILKDEAGKK